MRKTGCDEANLQMTDVICDFCRGEWTLQRPMVEGHQGACVCGPCLSQAYREVVLSETAGTVPVHCTMCLEDRQEAAWESPVHPEARICRRCIRQSAAVLQKDADSGWRKPQA